MDKKLNEYGSAFSDNDDNLFERQAALLNRIDVLVRNTALDTGHNTEDIYSLKQQYNHLVNTRAKLARISLSDPMDALPPELWPGIIKDIVSEDRNPTNTLLDLVSVSKSWFSSLVTLPVIWTTVRLDQSEADYLAKATTCIQLSGECKIDLHIYILTAEEWREISFRIIPEGRRIRRISFEFEYIDPLVIRHILGDFTELPVLNNLSLPYNFNGRPDEQYVHALVIEKMPSIEMVTRMGSSMESGLWNSFVTSHHLDSKTSRKEDLETLAFLPKLRHLTLIDGSQSLENAPSVPKSSLTSLVGFVYSGPAIYHYLTSIGNNLMSLTVYCSPREDINPLLVAISRFSRLDELRVNFSARPLEPTIQSTSLPPNTVRFLVFSNPGFDTSWDWELVFPVFFASSPKLETLSVNGGFLADPSWCHIQAIKNLRDLAISTCKIGHSSAIPVTATFLRAFQWFSDSQGLLELLTRLQSQDLQTLWLVDINYYPVTVTDANEEGGHTILPHCILSGVAFPNLTALTISSSDSVIWELRSLTGLRELELRARYQSHLQFWMGCVLEGVLVRPRDNPALEKITLKGTFADWDILLLMLERRNFLNQRGISSIQTLVVDYHLPYRFLHPLSELLGGRFVERDSNRSFSLEALGERLWDESSTGCLRCHCAFRKCKSLAEDRVMALGFANEGPPGLGQDYPLPHEYLVEDPPLPLDVILWLSGRRERQNVFMRKCKETGTHLEACYSSSPPYEKQVICITGDTLVGTHFGDEQDE